MKRKILLIGILIIGCIGLFLYIKDSNSSIIISQEFVFEYGETLDSIKKHIQNHNEFKDIKDIQFDFVSLQSDNQYPSVGDYQVPFQYSTAFTQKSSSFKLVIKDTTAPKFEKFKDIISINFNDSHYDFTKHFKATDLSDCSLTIDTKNIDFKKVGTYKATVIAKDQYNNQTIQEFQVIIKEELKEKVPESSGKLTYVKGILVVNKKHPIPSSYAPGENKTAGRQVRKLIQDMQSLGYHISDSYSGYRSYSYQKKLYTNYVKRNGQKKADTFSARPGYSEHQTGLAFDLKHTNGTLVETKNEIKWIAENAHKYGFIVRYTSSKQSITGFIGEPWHLRYIGDEATQIYQSGLSLEEYLEVEGGEY